MTSSTVCALAAKEKNTMAAATGRKRRTTLENSRNGVSRKSIFMNSPHPTIGDITSNGRDRIDKPFIIRTESAALSSRLSSLCQEISLHRRLELHMQSQRRNDYRSAVSIVSGIVDVLQAERRINSPSNMERVIRFDDVLAPEIRGPSPRRKPEPPSARYS